LDLLGGTRSERGGARNHPRRGVRTRDLPRGRSGDLRTHTSGQLKLVIGAYLEGNGKITCSRDSRDWFDLSLISVHGRQRADELKVLNRQRIRNSCLMDSVSPSATRKTICCYLLPPPISEAMTDEEWAHYGCPKITGKPGLKSGRPSSPLHRARISIGTQNAAI